MLFLGQTPEKMSGLPFVYINLGIFRFIPDFFGETAVVLVRVCQHDAADIGNPDAISRQTFFQSIGSLNSFWPYIYEGQRVILDQINVDRPNIKRGRNAYRNYLHL